MIYSHSRVSTFQTCPLKYRYQYLDGLGKEIEEEHMSLILGKSVHAALEDLYTRVSDLEKVSESQLLWAYDAAWQAAVPDMWDSSSEQSNSPWGTDAAASTDASAQEIFYRRGVVYLKRYYQTYAPFTRPKPMKVEYRLQFLLDEQVQFQGILDRVDIEWDTITIVDYKTNKALPTNDHDTHHDQLALYGLGIEQKYGGKFRTLLGKLIYLHLEKEVQFEITYDEIERIRQKYLAVITDIEDKTTRYMQGRWEENAFPHQVWPHCDYCPFQQICPAWKHKYMDDQAITLGALGQTTIKKIIDEYATLSKQISALEKQKDLLKQELLIYAAETKLPKIFGNAYKLSLVSKDYLGVTNEELAREKLQKLNLLEQAIKVDTNKLQKLLEHATDLAKELEQCISWKTTTYFAAPSAIKDTDETQE